MEIPQSHLQDEHDWIARSIKSAKEVEHNRLIREFHKLIRNITKQTWEKWI